MADELISREAVIEQLELLAKYEDSFRQSVILGVVHTIKCAPSVNAVVLPCKVGDTVYRLLWSHGGKKRWNFHIAEQRVKNLHDIVDCIEGLNKTVFLTREEAEKALEGREDNGR